MNRIEVNFLNEEQKQELEIPSEPQPHGPWSVWECDPSTFDWYYDQPETAYVYEGKVRVKTPEGVVEINAGDLVTFPKDLACTWEVLKKVRKVYKFE